MNDVMICVAVVVGLTCLWELISWVHNYLISPEPPPLPNHDSNGVLKQ